MVAAKPPDTKQTVRVIRVRAMLPDAQPCQSTPIIRKARYPRIISCANRGGQNDVEKRAFSMENRPFSMPFSNGRCQTDKKQTLRFIRIRATRPDTQ